jgi:hypothetical protein
VKIRILHRRHRDEQVAGEKRGVGHVPSISALRAADKSGPAPAYQVAAVRAPTRDAPSEKRHS